MPSLQTSHVDDIDRVQVVEMAPAVALDSSIRKKLHDDAVKLARHVNYRNAGTVEFMVEPSGAHYFLEVNPRIQVWHGAQHMCRLPDVSLAAMAIAPHTALHEQLVDFIVSVSHDKYQACNPDPVVNM